MVFFLRKLFPLLHRGIFLRSLSLVLVKRAYIVACALMFFSVPAHAQLFFVGPFSIVEVGTGFYDARRHGPSSYREVKVISPEAFRGFDTFAGITGTSTEDAYVFFGVSSNSALPEPFLMSFSFAAGLYTSGLGIDLGHPVEFRSSIRAGWQFHEGHSLAIEVSHLSNGHLAESNPGLETVGVVYSFPARL